MLVSSPVVMWPYCLRFLEVIVNLQIFVGFCPPCVDCFPEVRPYSILYCRDLKVAW
jgi:hypothetical protein